MGPSTHHFFRINEQNTYSTRSVCLLLTNFSSILLSIQILNKSFQTCSASTHLSCSRCKMTNETTKQWNHTRLPSYLKVSKSCNLMDAALRPSSIGIQNFPYNKSSTEIQLGQKPIKYLSSVARNWLQARILSICFIFDKTERLQAVCDPVNPLEHILHR